MATIGLSRVEKRFGATRVIHGIDLEVDDGEFIVIVGPSGCGKSTLLRMVAGLETISDGEIRIGERRVNELEPMERDIAMVFQSYALYPHMTVFGNMAYGLKIAGTPKAEIEERVRAAARMLELEPFLDRKPRALSGGQRQRVAMGRAIVRKPSVFLFDEPLSNLDAKLRVQMRLEIRGLQRELGVTALYVTHDQVEAMTLADRMVVMNEGVAEQVGRPLDVYADPEATFVAGFIGSPPMNFIAEGALDGPAASGLAIPRGTMHFGIRPEHLSEVPATDALVEGRLSHIEALGAETLYHLILADGTAIVWRRSGAPGEGERGEGERGEGGQGEPEPGAVIHIGAQPGRICFFDRNGRRIRG